MSCRKSASSGTTEFMASWRTGLLSSRTTYQIRFLNATLQETDSSVQGTASSASRFTRLATLSLLPHRSLNTDSVYKNVLTAKDERRTAACFFKTVPSLIRITFPVSIAKAEESLWYARSREVAVAQDVVIEKTKSWKG